MTALLFRGAKVTRATGSYCCCFNFNTRNCSNKNVGGDHYDTLGLPRTASKKQIRSAFLRLSKQYHPDVKADSGAKSEEFIKISEAYGVLSNRQKKDEYDYNLLRRDDPTMPPVDDPMAPFYKDGTFYRGPRQRIDTGFTNNQVVSIIVVLAALAGIAQYIRVRMVAQRQIERDKEAQQKAMDDIATIRTNAASGRTALLLQMVEARKEARGDKNKNKSGTETESLIDPAPNA